MLRFFSYLVFALLLVGIILSSAGFINKGSADSEIIKFKANQNGYNTISINSLDSLSAASNLDFTKLVR
jgi:hypothetical protein